MTVCELARKYPTASHYISQIYLIMRDYGYCNNHRLAEMIGVSASAVSQSAGRLKRLELIEQDRYGMITLTDYGQRLAKQILKRHYLLEYLMVRQLEYPWDLADREAEQLQDKVSDLFIDHLDERMGYPGCCPHGNPMPDNPRTDQILAFGPVDTVKDGSRVSIVRITEEGERYKDLLHFCYINRIMPEDSYRVFCSDTGQVELCKESVCIPIPREYCPFIRVRVEEDGSERTEAAEASLSV